MFGSPICTMPTGLSRQNPRALRRRFAEERLPRRVTFGYMAVRKGYSLGQEKDWTGCVEQDLREFGIKSEG